MRCCSRALSLPSCLLAADHAVGKLREARITLDAIGQPLGQAVLAFRRFVVFDLLVHDVEPVCVDEPAKSAAGEGIRVSLIDLQHGEPCVKECAPGRVDVDGQVQGTIGFEDALDLLENASRLVGMIENVIDDHQRAGLIFEGKVLARPGLIRHSRISQTDERRPRAIEMLQRIDGMTLSPPEEVDDADGAAADLENLTVLLREVDRLQTFLELFGAPGVPIEPISDPGFDVVAETLPIGLLVGLCLDPAWRSNLHCVRAHEPCRHRRLSEDYGSSSSRIAS